MNAELTDAEKEMLVDILRKMKADRSPYVPIQYFKHHYDYKRTMERLRRKDLVFPYKDSAIGLTQDGALIARKLLEEGKKS